MWNGNLLWINNDRRERYREQAKYLRKIKANDRKDCEQLESWVLSHAGYQNDSMVLKVSMTTDFESVFNISSAFGPRSQDELIWSSDRANEVLK